MPAHKRKANLFEFTRYLIAGTTSFLIDFSILYLLTELVGINYLISNVFGYLAGFFTAYFLSIRWVFRYRKYTNIFPELTIFTTVGLLGISLNELVMYVSVSHFAHNYLLAKVLATGVVFLFNFILRKFLLFSAPLQKRDESS